MGPDRQKKKNTPRRCLAIIEYLITVNDYQREKKKTDLVSTNCYYDQWIRSDLLFALGRRKQNDRWCRIYRVWRRCRRIDGVYYSLLWQACRRRGPRWRAKRRKLIAEKKKKKSKTFSGGTSRYMGFRCDVAGNFHERSLRNMARPDEQLCRGLLSRDHHSLVSVAAWEQVSIIPRIALLTGNVTDNE